MKGIFQSKQDQNSAQLDAPGREGGGKQASVCERVGDGENASLKVITLSLIMKGVREEREHDLRLLKSHKGKRKRKSLWDKRQRNGKVKCIKPENYQKNG